MLPSLGFIQTVLDCYRNHHKLVLRPDDIWIAIMVQWSIFVNSRAEELRHRFVNHNGTQELAVVIDSTQMHLTGRISEQVAHLMRDRILDRIKESERNWVVGRFSTTTVRDEIVGSITLMATMQRYFRYTGRIFCGIPEITLRGKVQDWQSILDR